MLGYVFDCRFVSLRVRSSKVSVVFDFNASLNDDAPLSPTLFPVVVERKEKSDLLMDVFGVFCCLYDGDRVL